MSAVVYWLLDAEDNILYVGCTSHLRTRMIQHAYTKGAWWPDVASVAITDEMSRREAQQVECRDILEMHPRYNIRTITPELDRPVRLGDGKRKLLRDLTTDDLRNMDRDRWRESRKEAGFHNAAQAYDDWRTTFELAMAGVVKHGSFGAAVESGAFKP